MMKIRINTRVGVTQCINPEIEARGMLGGVGIMGWATETLGNCIVISGKGIRVAVPVIGIASVFVKIPLAGCSWVFIGEATGCWMGCWKPETIGADG